MPAHAQYAWRPVYLSWSMPTDNSTMERVVKEQGQVLVQERLVLPDECCQTLLRH